MNCERCDYCKFPRSENDNGGACKCRLMKYKTIDVFVCEGQTPNWCPLKKTEKGERAMWSKSIEIFNPYKALKQARIKREKTYTSGGYLYIKSYNPYVDGVVGTDIKLTFKQKIQILFCKGVSVCIGNVIKTGRREGE